MIERAKTLCRRSFLLAAGAGGAMTAAAIVTKASPPAPSMLRSHEKRATRGYHASEHVNHYYRTAKA